VLPVSVGTPAPDSGTIPALEVQDLVVRYPRPWLRPRPEAAVDGVSLSVAPGEVLALVGESGSGKTSLARAALALLPVEAGTTRIFGEDWRELPGRLRRRRRGRAQLLLQDADASLDPGLRVIDILRASARLHRPGQDDRALALTALRRVGLEARALAWPRELSGGEKRRVGIAMVLLPEPELLVADEPTSGLDAALKADLLDLLLRRQRQGAALLLVTHDLPAALYAAGRLAVMLGGRIVEELPRAALSTGPHHPYTWSLMAASALVSDPSPPIGPALGRGVGCPWRGACPLERPLCASRPPWVELGPGHRVACHALGAPT